MSSHACVLAAFDAAIGYTDHGIPAWSVAYHIERIRDEYIRGRVEIEDFEREVWAILQQEAKLR
jgi:hypothetical protein